MSLLSEKLLKGLNYAKNQTLRSAPKIAQSAAKTFYNINKPLGQALGTAILAPIENRRLNQEQRTADLMAQIGSNRQARGATAQPYFNSAQRLTQNVADQRMQLANQVAPARRQAVTGAFNNAFSVFGAGNLVTKTPSFALKGAGLAYPATNAAIGGLIGGVTAPLAGQSFSQGIGQGVGSSFKYGGLNKTITPFTGTITDSFTKGKPMVQQLLARQVGAGLGNVGEDTLDTALTQNRPPTIPETAFSFLMGAAFQAAGDVGQARKYGKLIPTENPLFEIVDGNIKPRHNIRNELGRYAEKAGVSVKEAKKQLQDFSDWYNQPIAIRNQDGPGSVRYIKRGEAGFARIPGGDQDQTLRKTTPGSYTNVRQIDNKLAPKDFTNTNPAKQVLEDQSVARDFERTMNQQNVKAKVNLVDYLRTPQNVLKKIGLGKQGEALQKGYENYRLELGQELDKINTWFKQAPDPQSSENIFRHLDGETVDLSPTEKKLATEIRGYLKGWAKRLGLPEDKQIKNYITHLFDDQLIQKEFDPELAKLIDEKVPGSVYDPFLQKRYGIDGYKTDVWQALDAYVKRGVRKANMDPALERLQEASKSLDLESYKYIQRLASRVNLRPTEVDNLLDNFIKSTPIGYKLTARPTAKITRSIRNTIYRATLGLNVGSAVRNLSQGVNTYAKLGEKYTLIGYSKLIGKFASRDWDELKKVGVLEDNIVQDRHISAMKGVGQKIDSTLWVFFDLAEKINRGSAYFGAKSKALAKGMNEDQAIEYAKKIVKDTQFTFGSVDTPVALSSDLVKTLAQFQSYNIKQAEFLGGMIKNKEFGGMVRYIGATLAISASVGKVFGYGPSDALPFADLVGEGKFTSPLGQLVETTHGLLSPDEDKRKSAVRDLPKAASLLIPGGVQAKKTVEGLNTANKGYSETSTGRVRFPVEQSTSNKVRAGLFGQWNLPEAREYFDKDRSVLGENQSTLIKNAPDKKTAYNQIISNREQNSLISKVKESLQGDKQVKDAKPASYSISGSDYEGYSVGDRFIYMNEDGEVKTKSIKSIKQAQVKEEKSLVDANYSLVKDRLTRSKNYQELYAVNQQYLKYLKDYQKKLDPKTDQKEIISLQNKIEDIEATLAKGVKSGGSSKKTISDAQLLSAYKKALSSANASTNYKISNFTNQLNQIATPRLKRQVIRSLT